MVTYTVTTCKTLSNVTIVEIEDRLVVVRDPGWKDDEKGGFGCGREMYVLKKHFGFVVVLTPIYLH